MDTEIDLLYDPNTFVGDLNKAEVNNFETWLHSSGYTCINFDESYVAHLQHHHGGIPGKRYLKTSTGTTHAIVRFLNFLEPDSGDAMAQYSVESTWSAINESLGLYLIPFAELFSGDMACFDYAKCGKPEVVVWYHELSRPKHPYIEFCSGSFDEFLKSLTDQLP